MNEIIEINGTKVPSEVTFHELLVNNDKVLISCELSLKFTVKVQQ